jgi:hypothetical protein
MSNSISGSISRISKVSPELNRLTNEATEQIRSLDALLEKLAVGISCTDESYFLEGRERNSMNHLVYALFTLGYGRDDDGKFGLIVRAEVPETNTDGEILKTGYGDNDAILETLWVRKLEKCSREVRIESLRRLPELIEQLAKKAESTVATLRDGVTSTQAVVDQLKVAIAENK